MSRISVAVAALLLGSSSLPGRALPPQGGAGRAVRVDDLIFESEKAAALFRQARQVFAPGGTPDHRQAIELYEKAIAAQPGAKVNAYLANRIAQLYAFHADSTRGIRPEPARARAWWQRCAAMTSPRQLLWAQAHIGMASAAVMNRELASAQDAYESVLDIRPSEVELPEWRDWQLRFGGGADGGGGELERELKRTGEDVTALQRGAVRKIYYVAKRRFSRSAALAVLQKIARDHQGTAVADEASSITQGVLNSGQSELYQLPEWAFRDAFAEMSEASAEAADAGPPAAAELDSVATGRCEQRRNRFDRHLVVVGMAGGAGALLLVLVYITGRLKRTS